MKGNDMKDRFCRTAWGVVGFALAMAACDDSTGPDPDPEPGAAVISADITSNRTLYRDTVYTLSGFIHVQAPAVLTIQSGTTILGDYSKVGSSLFIMRGARIQAVGTANDPIVFTSSQPVGQRRRGDWRADHYRQR
jgi:hypothetical protein